MSTVCGQGLIKGNKPGLIKGADDLPQIQAVAKVSNVVTINGQDATSFLKDEAFYNMADPDSAWNYLFWNTARDPKMIPLV